MSFEKIEIRSFHPREIEYPDQCSIVNLINETWPPSDNQIASINDDLQEFFNSEPEEIHVVAKIEKMVVGYAKTFVRKIRIDGKLVRNMALACVCVRKEFQKNGIGKKIVKKVFEPVDNEKFALSIFQTAVPQFYEKVGAKKIFNKCINSQNDNENPWWDPNIMIYPGTYKIDVTEIDLMGKGY
jgi:predicted N-acetyltransferase YhbS